MIVKYFYVYPYDVLVKKFPCIADSSPMSHSIIYGGWVPTMTSCTNKIYKICLEEENYVNLTGVIWHFDLRLGKILQVEINDHSITGCYYLIRDKEDSSRYHISPIKKPGYVGRIVNMPLPCIKHKKQLLNQIFQSCKKE